MESFNAFIAIVKDVWMTGIFGVNVGDVLVAFAIIYIFILLRQLSTRFLIAWLRIFTSRTKSTIDDKILECVEGPLRLLPVTLGFFLAGQYLEIEGNLDIFVSNLVRSLVAVTIFWSAFNLTEVLSRGLGKARKVFTPVMVSWLVKTVKIIFSLIGVATVLEIWGIQVGPIIAGLGLFGVAVALGAQDLFKNLIAGVLVIAERRFNIGDWVLVDGVVEGTVEKIGFRSTVVRRFDKAPVYVPNAKFSDNAVTNFSAMTHRRICWKIGVEYSTSVEQLREVRDNIEGYILGHEDFAQPP
ncbi:MAG: MscS family membrane protein, partial [bacterium]